MNRFLEKGKFNGAKMKQTWMIVRDPLTIISICIGVSVVTVLVALSVTAGMGIGLWAVRWVWGIIPEMACLVVLVGLLKAATRLAVLHVALGLVGAVYGMAGVFSGVLVLEALYLLIGGLMGVGIWFVSYKVSDSEKLAKGTEGSGERVEVVLKMGRTREAALPVLMAAAVAIVVKLAGSLWGVHWAGLCWGVLSVGSTCGAVWWFIMERDNGVRYFWQPLDREWLREVPGYHKLEEVLRKSGEWVTGSVIRWG